MVKKKETGAQKPPKPVTSMNAVRITIELFGFEQLATSECLKCPLKTKPCVHGLLNGFQVTGCEVPVNLAMAESIVRGITGMPVKLKSK